jgi:hypothetical protein
MEPGIVPETVKVSRGGTPRAAIDADYETLGQ